MSHEENESCHTYERDNAQRKTSHVTQVNESCHICERVLSHIWMRHVMCVNESSSHVWIFVDDLWLQDWVTHVYVWMCPVRRLSETSVYVYLDRRLREDIHTYTCVHVWMSCARLAETSLNMYVYWVTHVRLLSHACICMCATLYVAHIHIESRTYIYMRDSIDGLRLKNRHRQTIDLSASRTQDIHTCARLAETSVYVCFFGFCFFTELRRLCLFFFKRMRRVVDSPRRLSVFLCVYGIMILHVYMYV